MDIIKFEIFLLILARIASFFVSSPFFSMKGLPAMVKIGFSFMMTVIIFVMGNGMQIDIISPIMFYVLLIQEVLVGLALGFITNLVFMSIQMAGQMADIQLGFSMSATFDPVSQSSVSIYGRIYNWIGIALFFAVNGHYFLIYAIAESFKFAPVGVATIQNINVGDVVTLFSKSFLVALQISVPLILVAFMTDIIMGFIARTVPQLNVFILGLPLKVLVGMIAFVILLPQITNLMIQVVQDMPMTLEKIIRIL